MEKSTRADMETTSNDDDEDDTLNFNDDMTVTLKADEKTRSDLETDFENEKHDIVQGFLIEKKILTKEHDKDKRDMMARFVKERESMLHDFQQQVEIVEKKLSTRSDASATVPRTQQTEQTRALNEDKRSHTERDVATSEKRLLVRLAGATVSPEEVISSIELEEKREHDKDTIEKSFRKEKERIRSMLEMEYERRFLREKMAHENEIRTLKADIDHLKVLRNDVGSLWQGQASRLEAQFAKERADLERHYTEEVERIRRKVERKQSHKLKEQQRQYDACITELKDDLKRLKQDLYEAKTERSKSSEVTKQKLMKEFQEHFYNETKALREHNERLNNELTVVTKEKYEFTRKLRDLEASRNDETHSMNEYSSKLNKEYKNRVQKLSLDVDRLKQELKSANERNEELLTNLRRRESDVKLSENKQALSEKSLQQCDDTIKCLRTQNENLSREINVLRNEKDEIQRSIEANAEKDRENKIEVSRFEDELRETNHRYVLIEREKLQQEKLIASLRRELGNITTKQDDVSTKVKNYEDESNRLRNLLDNERNENKRLHDRFQQDAELIRRKEGEIQTLRDEVARIKDEFANVKSRVSIDNDRIYKFESERNALLAQIDKLKQAESLNHKQEMISIQSKYVREFNKRLDYVKKNYESEIETLKNKISNNLCSCSNQYNPQQQNKTAFQNNRSDGSSQCSTVPICSGARISEENGPKCNVFFDNTKQERYDELLLSSDELRYSNRGTEQNHYDNLGAHSGDRFPKRTLHAINESESGVVTLQWSNGDEGSPRNGDLARRGHESKVVREHGQEKGEEKNDIRELLKEVRHEVTYLNKAIDRQAMKNPMEKPPIYRQTTYPRRPAQTTAENFQEDIEDFYNKQVPNCNNSQTHNSVELRRLDEEKRSLQQKLLDQEERARTQQAGNEELLKRKTMLEKLVDKLQTRLKEEKSQRKKLEQISEESYESTI